MDRAKINQIADDVIASNDEAAIQMLYGDRNGNVPDEHRPTTMKEKIHVAARTRLLSAGRIAVMASMLTAHQVREKKTIEIKELQPWPDREPHSTEPLLKGRRGKGTRRQRKAGR